MRRRELPWKPPGAVPYRAFRRIFRYGSYKAAKVVGRGCQSHSWSQRRTGPARGCLSRRACSFFRCSVMSRETATSRLRFAFGTTNGTDNHVPPLWPLCNCRSEISYEMPDRSWRLPRQLQAAKVVGRGCQSHRGPKGEPDLLVAVSRRACSFFRCSVMSRETATSRSGSPLGPRMGLTTTSHHFGRFVTAVEAARSGATGHFVGYFATAVTKRPKWWDVVVSPIRGPKGEPDLLVAVSRDITEHRQNEKALRDAHVSGRAKRGTLARRIREFSNRSRTDGP